jgi:hypothetical protein
MFTGAASVLPMTTLAKNRFHAKNNILFQGGVDKLEKSKVDFDQQIDTLRAAIDVHDKRDERISGQSPVPPPTLPTVVVVPAPATVPPPPPTTSGVRLPTPSPNVTPLGANRWEVVLPADTEYHTGIKVFANQNVVFSGWMGEVKLDPKEIYVNPPSGAYPTDMVKLTFPEPWVNSQAWTGALLARVSGEDYADIGGRVSNFFQAVEDGEVVLSINCLAGERHNASGSFRGIIEVQ